VFADLQLPRPPSFNEPDISDKSRFFADNPLLSEADIESLQQKYRLRIQSLQSVDDLVEAIVQKLEATGQLDNTYIFFASDNGFHLGDHRLLAGKNTAFEEDILVPLLVRGPNIKPGGIIHEISGNIDLAPTFAELAGVKPPEFVDGRSLVPLLEGKFTWSWRSAYLLERGTTGENGFFADWRIDLGTPPLTGEREPADSIYDYKAGGNFLGLRTNDYTYVEFQNGDVELYDLNQDPYELQNIAPTADPALLGKFHNWLSKLQNCAANSCRTLEINP
jgi:N-acetylglucosamine-6-sulfatase